MKAGDQVYMVEQRAKDGKVVNELEVMLRTEWGGKKMIGTITGFHPKMSQMVMVQWPNEDSPQPAFINELRVLSAVDLLGDLVEGDGV